MTVNLTPDQLVTALNRLDVPFLTGGEPASPLNSLSPFLLLGELIAQQEARLRLAVIPLLLRRPDVAVHVPSVVANIRSNQALQLKLYYTAAMFLQQQYQHRLQILFGQQPSLTDYFSLELKVPTHGSLPQRLQALARQHQCLTDNYFNWYGLYQHAAERLLKHMEWRKRCKN